MISIIKNVFPFSLGIGVAIGLLVAVGIGKRRLPLIVGSILVFALCLVYHAIATLFSGTIIYRTIIVPFGYGFGEGNRAYIIALLAQAILAGIVGMAVYMLVKMKK